MSPSWEYLWNQSLGIIHYAPYSSGHWNALESLACLPSLGQANLLMLYNDTQNLRWHIASYQVNDKCRYLTGLKDYIKVELCYVYVELCYVLLIQIPAITHYRHYTHITDDYSWKTTKTYPYSSVLSQYQYHDIWSKISWN